MELKDFVTESLTQIIQGVSSAQNYISNSDISGSVSPQIRNNLTNLEGKGVLISPLGALVQMVEFDVSVTATEGTGTKGGIGITVGVIALGSQGQSSQSSATTSKLKFSVPISFPVPSSTR